jgi:hypothetical protein
MHTKKYCYIIRLNQTTHFNIIHKDLTQLSYDVKTKLISLHKTGQMTQAEVDQQLLQLRASIITNREVAADAARIHKKPAKRLTPKSTTIHPSQTKAARSYRYYDKQLQQLIHEPQCTKDTCSCACEDRFILWSAKLSTAHLMMLTNE